MRYWVYINQHYDGPFSLQELLRLEGFTGESPVCAEGELEWQPAQQCPSIRPHWEARPLRQVPAAVGALRPGQGALIEGALKRPVVSTSGDYVMSQVPAAPSRRFQAPRRVYTQPAPVRRKSNSSVMLWVAAAGATLLIAMGSFLM